MKTIRFTAASGNATTAPVYRKAFVAFRESLLAIFGGKNASSPNGYLNATATEIAGDQFEATFPAYRMSQIVDFHRDYGMSITAAIVKS